MGVFAGGFISSAERLSHVSPMAKRLAKSVTIYTNGNTALLEATEARLNSSKILFDNRRITRFQLHADGPAVDITFEDGTSKTEGFVASHPNVVPSAPFAEQLGLERLPSGEVNVSGPFNQTSVEGCFAAGDGATPMKTAVQATQMGVFAGAGMATQLQAELEEKDEL